MIKYYVCGEFGFYKVPFKPFLDRFYEKMTKNFQMQFTQNQKSEKFLSHKTNHLPQFFKYKNATSQGYSRYMCEQS